uniref:SPRY domain-containing protein n=1 Tax=Strongyloides papillosus TaxID=174720 RepID=A0A0N5CAG1_STREA
MEDYVIRPHPPIDEDLMYEGRVDFPRIASYNNKKLLEIIFDYSTKRHGERICYEPSFPSNLLSHLNLTQDNLASFFDSETISIFEKFIVAARLSRKEIPFPPEALGLIENKNKCLFTNRTRIESIATGIVRNALLSSEDDPIPLKYLNAVFEALSISLSTLKTKLGKREYRCFSLRHLSRDKYLSMLAKKYQNIWDVEEEVVVNNNNTTQEELRYVSVGHEFNNRIRYPDQESLLLPTIAEDNVNGLIMYLLLHVFAWVRQKEDIIINEEGVVINYPPMVRYIKNQYGNIHRFYNAAYSDESVVIKHMSQIDFDWNHKINQRYGRSKLAIVDQSAIMNYLWATSTIVGLGNVQLKKGIKVFWQFQVFGRKECTSIMFGISSDQSSIWEYDGVTDVLGFDSLSWGINNRGYGLHNGIKKGVTKSFPKNWYGEYVGLLFNGFGEYGTLTYFLRGKKMGVIFDDIPLNVTYYPAFSSTGQFTEFKINKCLQSFNAVPDLKTIVCGKVLDYICTPGNINYLPIPENEKSKLKRMWDDDELIHDCISGHTHHYPHFR